MDTNHNIWNMAAYRAMVAGIVFKLCATFFILVVLGFLYTCYAQVLPTYATIATQYSGADSLQHRIGADSIYIRSNKPIALKGYWNGAKVASVVNGFVPYTGATADVSIYPFRFEASWLTSDYVDTGSIFLTDRKIYDGAGDSVIIRDGLSGTMAYLSDVPSTDDFVQASDTAHYKTDYNFIEGVDYQAPLSDVLQGTGSYPKYAFWSDISGFLGQSLYEDDTITRIINDIDSLASFDLGNVVTYSGNSDDLDMGAYNVGASTITADLAELTDLSLSGVVVSNGGLDTFYLPTINANDTFAMVSDIPSDFLVASDTVGFALRSWVQTFYQVKLTNPVTGTGVANKLVKWNSTSTIGDTDIKTLGGETLLGAGNIDFPLVAYDTTEITTTIDFATSRIFYRSISGTVTFEASNLQANKDVVLKLTVTGAPSITFEGLIGETLFLQDVTAYIGLKGVNTTQYIVTFINEL